MAKKKRIKKGVKRLLMGFGAILLAFILVIGGTHVYAAATNQSMSQVNGEIELRYKTMKYSVTKHTGTLYVNDALYGFVDGEKQIGWETIDKKTYYFQKTGKNRYHALTGMQTLNNKTYYFGESANNFGQMQTGFVTVKDKTYYFYEEGDDYGTMANGMQTIKGNLYLFSKTTGVMKTGWYTKGKKTYHFAKNGAAATSTTTIDGQTYDFSNKGTIESTILKMDEKAQGYSSETKYLVLVNTSAHRVAVYQGSKGHWVRLHYWLCGDGKKGTPTKHGTFRMGAKGSFKSVHFNSHGVRCFYATRITGHFLFHSITYKEHATAPKDSLIVTRKLGTGVSHGCVRLATANAYWVYKNIPRYTNCTIY